MINVIAALLDRERRESVEQGYPLPELRKFSAGQLVGQLRLSCENNLQELGPGSFEIRKQSDRLQHGRIQILRLVHNDDQPLAGTSFLQQQPVEFIVHANKILFVGLGSQFGEQKTHEFPRTTLRLKQKRRARIAAEFLQQVEKQGGLSHARLGNQCQKTTPRLDAVKERGESLAMRGTQIQKTRIGRNPEWLFP